jgi:hypothetical protein
MEKPLLLAENVTRISTIFDKIEPGVLMSSLVSKSLCSFELALQELNFRWELPLLPYFERTRSVLFGFIAHVLGKFVSSAWFRNPYSVRGEFSSYFSIEL